MPRRSASTAVLAAAALAYIDPGSGSYLVQLLIGTFIGVGAFLAFPVRKALGRLRRGRSQTDR